METILPLLSFFSAGIAGAWAWMTSRKVKELEREKLSVENDKLKAEAAITTVDSVKTVMTEFHNMTVRFTQLQNKYDELLDTNRQRDAKDREKEGMIGSLQDQLDAVEQDLNKKAEIYHTQEAIKQQRIVALERRADKLVDDLAEANKQTAIALRGQRECEEWKLTHMELHGSEDNHHVSEALYPG